MTKGAAWNDTEPSGLDAEVTEPGPAPAAMDDCAVTDPDLAPPMQDEPPLTEEEERQAAARWRDMSRGLDLEYVRRRRARELVVAPESDGRAFVAYEGRGAPPGRAQGFRFASRKVEVRAERGEERKDPSASGSVVALTAGDRDAPTVLLGRRRSMVEKKTLALVGGGSALALVVAVILGATGGRPTSAHAVESTRAISRLPEADLRADMPPSDGAQAEPAGSEARREESADRLAAQSAAAGETGGLASASRPAAPERASARADKPAPSPHRAAAPTVRMDASGWKATATALERAVSEPVRPPASIQGAASESDSYFRTR
jgi:hypothetical protein